jgi:hypothetical protein
MKKSMLLAVIAIGIQFGHAQDALNKMRAETSRNIKKEADTSKWNWKRGGLLSFNISQGSLSNWSAGGDNFSLVANGYFNYYFLNRKNRHTWDNNLDVNLGYVQTTSLGSRKNDDRFDFLSKFGYKIDSVGKVYVSTLFNFRSQFFDGFSFSGGTPSLSSSFLSPAYVILSVGFDYKPSDKFSLFLSPLTSRLTIIAHDSLAKMGLYGVPKGDHSINQIGAFATINYMTPIGMGIGYKGRLDLFSDYANNPQDVDFFMTNLFSFRINKFFSATYNLDMIYDDNVRLFGPNKNSPGLQLKSLIGIGFQRPIAVKKTTRLPKVLPPPPAPEVPPATDSTKTVVRQIRRLPSIGA